MEEVIGVGGPFKEALMVESLRLLARWLAREVLKKEKSRKFRKTREIQPPKSVFLP